MLTFIIDSMFKIIETNQPEIDAQHQELIECMNELHQASSKPYQREQIEKALEKLTSYTICHFAFEEHGMQHSTYPEIQAHQKEHQFFIMKLNEIKSRTKDDINFLTNEILVFLRHWLIRHIGNTDLEYVNYLRGLEF